ncbi:MAG: hypothetical protein ABJH07_07130 [Sedimentitalea sp.]|uniref:hypothetical protein n=1 Tax=Sedimentitalea sp. TaxID=2048915 RepID=UPI0032661037
MTERSLILLDNDILLKAAAYSLSGSSKRIFDIDRLDCQILSSAKYVLPQVLATKRTFTEPNAVKSEMEVLLSTFVELELTDAELEAAAVLEQLAIRNSLELDVGESQLLAVRITRSQGFLLTGDKRAISAIELLCDHVEIPENFVACLEQFMVSVLQQESFSDIRASVCSNATADKAVAICFSCKSPCADEANVVEALTSYITDLRKSSRRVLAEGTSLLAVVP